MELVLIVNLWTAEILYAKEGIQEKCPFIDHNVTPVTPRLQHALDEYERECDASNCPF